MAKGINKVILIGNLGQDPEVRYTATGSAVANISLATSDSWKDKQTGDKQERTEWHRVVFFDRLAEIVGQYLRKGSKVYVEGRLQTKKWQDKDGNDRYTTEIIANEMQMLDSRGGSEMESYTPAASSASYTPPAAQPPASRPAAAPQRAAPAASSSAPPPRDFDDDIPF